MKFDLLFADEEEELWSFGSWMFHRNLITGEGRWDHYSACDEYTGQWRDASPFAEEFNEI